MIPKIIFQTHDYLYEDLPEWFKETSMSWRNLNPGWEYVYHNDKERSEYVKSKSPELYKIYKNVVKPHQADIWRYLIVEEMGGVYADMDSFCIAPMDYILGGLPDHIDLVCTITEKREHTNNANFAAIKGSSILKSCSENILKENEGPRDRPNQTVIHDCFSDGVKNNLSIVSKTMVAEHSACFKKSFDSRSIPIDYYGKKMFYVDFVNKVM